MALIDAGHVVQNLYLACEAIECGTCAVAAIDQTVADALCCLDGKEEFIVYAAPVGLSDPKKIRRVIGRCTSRPFWKATQ